MKVIGITGGICSGKSSITSYLSNKDALIIDADKISHELMQEGTSAYNEVVAHFGDSILLDKTINRKALGEIVFNNKEERAVLDSIVHPKVKQEIESRIKTSNKDLIVLDIPLLIETGWQGICDSVWLVYVEETEQIKRLMTRNNLSKEQALARIKSQMTFEEKAKYADVIINNNRSFNQTIIQIEKILGL